MYFFYLPLWYSLPISGLRINFTLKGEKRKNMCEGVKKRGNEKERGVGIMFLVLPVISFFCILNGGDD